MSNNRYACIYIGPNTIEVISAQRGANRKVKTIDHARYPIEIGSEIHSSETITAHSGSVIERVVSEYIRLAKESSPDVISIVFSREISRAENFIFIYHRIEEIAEGCRLSIMTDEWEMALFCATSNILLSESFDFKNANVAMTSITGESIDFALTNTGLIDFAEEIPYGYFKIAEIVENITRERTHYSKLLSEIIENKLRLAVAHIGMRHINYVSLMTKDALALAENFKCERQGSLYIFTKETINSAYKELKELTPDQIQTLYPKLSEAQTLTIQSTITVARQLMRTCSTDQIILIQRSLAQAMVNLEFMRTKAKESRHWLEQSAYQSAIELSKRYNVDQVHAETVEYTALRIFDTLKKTFAMNDEMKFLLKLAARLLDIGQYGGEDGQAQACEEIIRREQLVGLTKSQQDMLARICRNTKLNSYQRTKRSEDFGLEEEITVAQLVAILKIATALDQSRRQKVSKLQCSLKEDELQLKVTTSHNTQLEKYYFKRDRIWMERVFEIKPVLHVKRVKT